MDQGSASNSIYTSPRGSGMKNNLKIDRRQNLVDHPLIHTHFKASELLTT